MAKQVTSTPQHLEMGGGGSGYLYLHYRPPVDWEPAINVDKVNESEEKTKQLSEYAFGRDTSRSWQAPSLTSVSAKEVYNLTAHQRL